MKKRITRFSVHQSSKLFAFMAAFVYGIMCGLWGLIMIFMDGNILQGILFALLMPLVAFIASYIIYAIIFIFYNMCSDFVGGIEFDLTDIAD